ncbi:flagellar hook-associated protein FlgK [Scandinavium goeteborgense]|uniref:Flagellar hook-associated protein 1 n=1 Tax=Scandinavium goeteborgense TaxID=1851514 RepID=A0A4R6EMW5_SCAGO|nr:flagellar hook-associated protein FlgK [Scandinavium goeteborgense]TDN59454.1 flagellar hook-associated protein 1 FlgK [Scandinavium goeteborgense]
MNNLFNLARSGLSTAQSALSVVGSNLTNGMSGNYSRRDIIIGESGGLTTSRGFYGYGAQVNGVQRAYDAFANSQLRGSISSWSALAGRNEQLSDIDDMLGNESDNVSVSLNNLFKAMATLEGNAGDGPSRSAVYNSLGALTQRFNESGKRLSGLEKSTNTHIEQSAKDINSATAQLAEVNKQLERIQAQNGTPPADLLDQRDALLEGLSEQIGIEVNENKVTGRVDVTLTDGRPLVSGDRAYSLETSPSASDPNKIIISYVGSDDIPSPINESNIRSGRLAGLLKFRSEDLEVARNELNQIAFQMATRFNEQHEAGFDLNGDAGEPLFSLPDIKARANSANTGTGSMDNIKVTDSSQVRAEDYTLSFDGANWTVTGADGRPVSATVMPGMPPKMTFEGVEIEIPAGVNAGDSFSLNPLAGMAEGIGRAIDSADKLAAAASATGGPGDHGNLSLLKGIQEEKLVGGNTLTGAYTKLVGTIGANAREVKSSLASAEIDLDTKYNTKQALSGVDMNEETVNLQMFMQYYQANAQILQTATSLFDTLLSIK